VKCRNPATSLRSIADNVCAWELLLDNKTQTGATVQLLTLLKGCAILACLQMDEQTRLQSVICCQEMGPWAVDEHQGMGSASMTRAWPLRRGP